MKVYIGPYTSWFGPYQLAETLLFWMDNETDKRVYKFGQWLAGDKDIDEDGNTESNETLLCKFLVWVESKKKRNVKVRIDKYDTWNMDSTLALIVLPMLKQLKATKHGAPLVQDEDVPEELRSTSAPPKENEWDTDGNHFKRWDWIMDEMIFAFESKQPDNDWEAQFYTGECDYVWKKAERTLKNPETGKEETVYQMLEGPKHTRVFDAKGYEEYAKRIENGFRLFGRYYQGLWD